LSKAFDWLAQQKGKALLWNYNTTYMQQCIFFLMFGSGLELFFVVA